VGLETRLAKNRVSTVGKKPGFDGWGKTGFRRLAKNRVSTVGKKPGFDRWQKTGTIELGIYD
jgi:hypothetical protein